jgi:hypothetical protein
VDCASGCDGATSEAVRACAHVQAAVRKYTDKEPSMGVANPHDERLAAEASGSDLTDVDIAPAPAPTPAVPTPAPASTPAPAHAEAAAAPAPAPRTITPVPEAEPEKSPAAAAASPDVISERAPGDQEADPDL